MTTQPRGEVAGFEVGDHTDRLVAVRQLADASLALLGAGIGRLVGETTAAAERAASGAAAVVAADLAGWAADHEDLPTPELDRAGRDWLADAVAVRVIARRSDHERRLDAEITALTDRLQHRVEEQITAVQAAAADAFDVRLAGPPVSAVPSTRWRSAASTRSTAERSITRAP